MRQGSHSHATADRESCVITTVDVVGDSLDPQVPCLCGSHIWRVGQNKAIMSYGGDRGGSLATVENASHAEGVVTYTASSMRIESCS